MQQGFLAIGALGAVFATTQQPVTHACSVLPRCYPAVSSAVDYLSIASAGGSWTDASPRSTFKRSSPVYGRARREISWCLRTTTMTRGGTSQISGTPTRSRGMQLLCQQMGSSGFSAVTFRCHRHLLHVIQHPSHRRTQRIGCKHAIKVSFAWRGPRLGHKGRTSTSSRSRHAHRRRLQLAWRLSLGNKVNIGAFKGVSDIRKTPAR